MVSRLEQQAQTFDLEPKWLTLDFCSFFQWIELLSSILWKSYKECGWYKANTASRFKHFIFKFDIDLTQNCLNWLLHIVVVRKTFEHVGDMKRIRKTDLNIWPWSVTLTKSQNGWLISFAHYIGAKHILATIFYLLMNVGDMKRTRNTGSNIPPSSVLTLSQKACSCSQ